MATLSLLNLSKHFGRVRAVDGINLEVADGEFLCMLGPSGCGKTTALRMIAGFETPSGGDIRIDDSSVVRLGANRRPTAMVFQQYTLWPHMTVQENIAFGLRLRRMNGQEIGRKVSDGLGMVGLEGYEQRYPRQLSGGQQQRVALARALVLEPKILLLDEPFSSLDALLRVRLREELRRIQRRLHITAIFVTHDQEEALSLADRIALMRAGRIEQLAPPSDLYANPRTLFAADFIGAMNLLPAELANGQLQIGAQRLALPDGPRDSATMTVAIRPEDFTLLPDTTVVDEADLWRGMVEQTMDMGHYRKVLVSLPGITEPIKSYMPKTQPITEGETVLLYPQRYLVYQGDGEPIEMHRPLAS
ncbi:MAG TPA: ABC transporter ATP-binding protein [Caldilineaceae bacterium]|nr:ABC transporter ATP-binding protein [Caldilineaceae bacterium]